MIRKKTFKAVEVKRPFQRSPSAKCNFLPNFSKLDNYLYIFVCIQKIFTLVDLQSDIFLYFRYSNNRVNIKVSFTYARVACVTVLLKFLWIFPSYSEMRKCRLSYNTACKKVCTISLSDSWIRTFLLLRYKFAQAWISYITNLN